MRNQGHEYTDQEYWLKWSNNKFVTKFKYLDIGSRALHFASVDTRFNEIYKIENGPAIR